MSILEKTITKRQLFVTVGCQKYPYQKIKELTEQYDNLNYRDIAKLEIEDFAKVVVIQELDILNPSIKRLLAFKFAEKTFCELKHLLSPDRLLIGEEALEMLRKFIMGESTMQELKKINKGLIKCRDEIVQEGNVNSNKKAIGCLEILLSVSKNSTYSAMREASSIQRDIMGDDWGTWQIATIMVLAENLHDMNY